MDEGALMNHVFLQPCDSQTWGRDGTRRHYGKKTGWLRQCDALGNILLGNLGS